MPTSRRDALKRKHTAISNALERSMDWTEELYDLFLEHHPDYAEGYANIHLMLEQAKGFIERMRSLI